MSLKAEMGLRILPSLLVSEGLKVTVIRLSRGSFVEEQSTQAEKLNRSKIFGCGHLHMKQIVWKTAKCLKELYYQRNHQPGLQKSVMTQTLPPFPGSKTFASRKQVLETVQPQKTVSPRLSLLCLWGIMGKVQTARGRARDYQAGALRNWLCGQRIHPVPTQRM